MTFAHKEGKYTRERRAIISYFIGPPIPYVYIYVCVIGVYTIYRHHKSFNIYKMPPFFFFRNICFEIDRSRTVDFQLTHMPMKLIDLFGCRYIIFEPPCRRLYSRHAAGYVQTLQRIEGTMNLYNCIKFVMICRGVIWGGWGAVAVNIKKNFREGQIFQGGRVLLMGSNTAPGNRTPNLSLISTLLSCSKRN